MIEARKLLGMLGILSYIVNAWPSKAAKCDFPTKKKKHKKENKDGFVEKGACCQEEKQLQGSRTYVVEGKNRLPQVSCDIHNCSIV